MNWFPFLYLLANLITNSIHAWLTKDYRSSAMIHATLESIHLNKSINCKERIKIFEISVFCFNMWYYAMSKIWFSPLEMLSIHYIMHASCPILVLRMVLYKSQQRKPFQGPFSLGLYPWYQIPDLLWPGKVHEHVSYKSEYTVMGPCVVIVKSWILMVRTWVLWWGHSILKFMITGLSTLVLLRPQKELPTRDTIENTWKRRDLVMIY